MADDDRGTFSEASSDNDQDDVMDDVDNDDTNADPDEDNNDDNEDENQDDGADGIDQADAAEDAFSKTKTLDGTIVGKTDEPATSPRPSPRPPQTAQPRPPQGRTVPRPEALSAKLYDIVPTMAAPQATSVNCFSTTPDLKYWFTGGSDGYIRKYNGPDTINGKTLLTVAQRHPYVDSVVKAGVLMSYWGNEEPAPASSKAGEDPKLSPVYSLAAHSRALWLLSGLQSGGINLQSVRHDEGKKICCLQRHTSAVSVLTLVPDEKSVLSGSWDKTVLDWDLNTGAVRRSFEGSGGQISAIELRPASGSPFPAHANELVPGSDTFTQNVGPRNNLYSNAGGNQAEPQEEAQESPVHDSLFGGSPAGSLFGDNDGTAFGMDDDNGGPGLDIGLQDDSLLGGDGSNNDVTMTGLENPGTVKDESASASATQKPPEVKPEPPSTPQASAAQEELANVSQTNGVASSSSTADSQTQPQRSQIQPPVDLRPASPSRPGSSSEPPKPQAEPGQMDENTFFAASIDGTIRIWDRRVADPVAKITPRGTPPWCMGACWSPDGNWIYAGRRNNTVEEFSIHKARRGWSSERVFKLPGGSGPVTAVRPMPNGRHLVCASHDILRLYDLTDQAAFKHSTVPFLIIPGPPRAGVISSLYIDPTARFMISTAGTRGWEGTSTEGIIGYEIAVVDE